MCPVAVRRRRPLLPRQQPEGRSGQTTRHQCRPSQLRRASGRLLTSPHLSKPHPLPCGKSLSKRTSRTLHQNSSSFRRVVRRDPNAKQYEARQAPTQATSPWLRGNTRRHQQNRRREGRRLILDSSNTAAEYHADGSLGIEDGHNHSRVQQHHRITQRLSLYAWSFLGVLAMKATRTTTILSS